MAAGTTVQLTKSVEEIVLDVASSGMSSVLQPISISAFVNGVAGYTMQLTAPIPIEVEITLSGLNSLDNPIAFPPTFCSVQESTFTVTSGGQSTTLSSTAECVCDSVLEFVTAPPCSRTVSAVIGRYRRRSKSTPSSSLRPLPSVGLDAVRSPRPLS